jgi:putative endonuclease
VAAKDELGRAGEQVARRTLEEAGLIVLDQNWRCSEGELDLVATDGHGTAIFCEVKTRSGEGFGTPREAVTTAKRRKLRRLAHVWLSQRNSPWVALRFDVVGILWPAGAAPTVRHLPQAF